MPDDLKVDPAAGAGNGAGEGQGGDQKPPEKPAGEGNPAGEGGGGENKPEGGDKPPEGEKPKPPEKPPEGDQEPPTRKRLSAQDFIIGRQHKKLSKAGKPAGEGADDKGDEPGEDDEIAPEDEELITKVVNKRFAPILNNTIAAEDDKEISAFLKDNPDFAPYEAKARKYIAHPSRRHLPIKSVFLEVAGDDLLKLGAARQIEAEKKAKGTQTGGGSNRGGEGKPKGAFEMSPEEFAAHQDKVRRGQ